MPRFHVCFAPLFLPFEVQARLFSNQQKKRKEDWLHYFTSHKRSATVATTYRVFVYRVRYLTRKEIQTGGKEKEKGNRTLKTKEIFCSYCPFFVCLFDALLPDSLKLTFFFLEGRRVLYASTKGRTK